MNKFITFFVTLILLLSTSMCFAKPQILTWEWPVDDCDGEILAQADFIESELIYSLSPMPMPSDTSGPCSANTDPGPPVGALTVPVPITDNSVILNLQPGQTYFARIRGSAYVAGNWSSWSAEHQFTVPYGRPNKFIIGSGLNRYEYYLIEDPAIHLGSKS